MDFKTSLDTYLTSPPDNGFDSWVNLVYEYYSEYFFEVNELWLIEDNPILDKWLNNLFFNGHNPKDAAAIIERAFNLYIKN